MHELSIAMSILEMAQEQAQAHGGSRVEAIHLRIGALSGVVTEALRSAYELAAEQTPFADCRLQIEEVPIIVYCAKCDEERPARSAQWLCCAKCDTPSSRVLRGRELELAALELSP